MTAYSSTLSLSHLIRYFLIYCVAHIDLVSFLYSSRLKGKQGVHLRDGEREKSTLHLHTSTPITRTLTLEKLKHRKRKGELQLGMSRLEKYAIGFELPFSKSKLFKYFQV